MFQELIGKKIIGVIRKKYSIILIMADKSQFEFYPTIMETVGLGEGNEKVEIEDNKITFPESDFWVYETFS
jgi:hypothetical protein